MSAPLPPAGAVSSSAPPPASSSAAVAPAAASSATAATPRAAAASAAAAAPSTSVAGHTANASSQRPASAPPDAHVASASVASSSPRAAAAHAPPHQPEVRLIIDGDRYVGPEEVRRAIIQPAGVQGALTVVPCGPGESRVVCRSWSEAYQILTYCTAEVQRRVGVRCRPAVIDGISLTRTQVARLAQAEGPPHQHILRPDSSRAIVVKHQTRSPRAQGVPPQ